MGGVNNNPEEFINGYFKPKRIKETPVNQTKKEKE